MQAAQNILVTGATGFLGAHLVGALRRAGDTVISLARAESNLSRLHSIGGDHAAEICALEDRAALTALIARTQPDTIFHLAGDTSVRHFSGDWQAVDRAQSANVSNSLNLLRAAMESGAPVKRIIRTGGLEEYGDGPKPASETQATAPTSPYSASQAAVTGWFSALQHQTPIMLTTLRPALVYGPGQGGGFLIPALIAALLRKDVFAMGDGLQRRDLLYVDDMIAAFMLTRHRNDLRGAVINISSGKAQAMRSVALKIGSLLGATDLLKFGAIPGRAMDLDEVSGTNALALARLGWAPQVLLDDGLRRTIDAVLREHQATAPEPGK